jgi:hypothetical protein
LAAEVDAMLCNSKSVVWVLQTGFAASLSFLPLFLLPTYHKTDHTELTGHKYHHYFFVLLPGHKGQASGWRGIFRRVKWHNYNTALTFGATDVHSAIRAYRETLTNDYVTTDHRQLEGGPTDQAPGSVLWFR